MKITSKIVSKKETEIIKVGDVVISPVSGVIMLVEEIKNSRNIHGKILSTRKGDNIFSNYIMDPKNVEHFKGSILIEISE